MVATIRFITSPRKAVIYNETKVNQGLARLLTAENYPLEAASLRPADKANRLEWMAAINPRVKKKGMHIFLGFTRDESLQDVVMAALSRGFMEGLGYGKQPYLVYVHEDMAIPHLHLLTTTVNFQGKLLSIYEKIKLGQVNELLRGLEGQYGLMPASESIAMGKRPETAVQRGQYGREETVYSISKILDQTLPQFHFEDRKELNALLGVYRVKALFGRPGTPMYERKGVVYAFMDHKDRQIGVPVPAFRLPQRPSVASLERKMEAHRNQRQKVKSRLGKSPELFFGEMPQGWEEFRSRLAEEGILTSWVQMHKEDKPNLYYVDMIRRRVFGPDHLPEAWQYHSFVSAWGEWSHETRYALPTQGKQRRMALGVSQSPGQGKGFGEEGAHEWKLKRTKAAEDSYPYYGKGTSRRPK